MNEFRAGQVLSRAMRVWGKNLIPFSVLALICFIPDFLFTYVALKDGLQMSAFMYSACSTGLSLLLGMIAVSSMTYGTFQEMRGRPASLGESVSVGLGRIFGVLGTSILVWLA